MATEISQPSSDEPGGLQRLTPTDVAHRLGKRYLKARDMMLQGKFGKAVRRGRTLTVSLAGVIRWEQEQRRLAQEGDRDATRTA